MELLSILQICNVLFKLAALGVDAGAGLKELARKLYAGEKVPKEEFDAEVAKAIAAADNWHSIPD